MNPSKNEVLAFIKKYHNPNHRANEGDGSDFGFWELDSSYGD
jgi:hypothetical protein